MFFKMLNNRKIMEEIYNIINQCPNIEETKKIKKDMATNYENVLTTEKFEKKIINDTTLIYNIINKENLTLFSLKKIESDQSLTLDVSMPLDEVSLENPDWLINYRITVLNNDYIIAKTNIYQKKFDSFDFDLPLQQEISRYYKEKLYLYERYKNNKIIVRTYLDNDELISERRFNDKVIINKNLTEEEYNRKFQGVLKKFRGRKI